MQLDRFREAYLEAMLVLLWRQWSALGVLGHHGFPQIWPIDPEALLTATTRFGRYDPRLFDASLEWWIVNGKWLSTNRLQRLQRQLPQHEQSIIAAMVDTVGEHKGHAKWRSIARRPALLPERGQQALFLLRDGKALPHSETTDPIFLRRGYSRESFVARRVAKAVDPHTPPAIRFKLRAFFGVGSRPEIALFLLTHEAAHALRIAKQIQFSQPSVSSVLGELSASGLVSERKIGREVSYRIERPEWHGFLRVPEEIRWLEWFSVFEALHHIWRCVIELKDRAVSPSIIDSELRRCARRVNALLQESEIHFEFAEAGANYQGVFTSECEKLLKTLGLTEAEAAF